MSERVGESARRAADAAEDALRRSGIKDKATEAASDASKKAGEVFDDAKEKASDLFGDARRYYENASGAARASASAARLPSSLLGTLASARRWAKKNPGKAAVVSLAFIAGTRAGSAFSSLDVMLLGAGGAGNWLFHSAIVPYGLRKLSEKYETYLKRQEELIRDGKLTEAERVASRSFSATWRSMSALRCLALSAWRRARGWCSKQFTGAAVTGFPINIVLGGNPLLSSIWLFGNGLVCFHNGYKFFMMALGDQEDVTRVVRDIKGLLPAEVA